MNVNFEIPILTWRNNDYENINETRIQIIQSISKS